MKRWWVLVALLLSLGINVGLLASRVLPARGAPEISPVDNEPGSPVPPASPGEESPTGWTPPFVFRMADELRLTGADRDTFVARQRLFLEQTIAGRERMVGLQTALRRELVDSDPDRAAVDELLEEIAGAHVDLERAFVDNLLDTRELLGPEQERRYMRMLQHLRRARDDVGRRFRERFPNRPGLNRPGFDRPDQERSQRWRRNRRAPESSPEESPTP